MIKLVDLDKQDSGMQQDILAGIKEVIQSKNFINGPKVRELEKRWASLSNTEHAIGCSNGTSALEIALKSCGVGAGDEVIVPAMTFIATAEAVANVGAKPVFVDIGTDGTIDVTKMKEAITSSTRAVIPVHLYGNICDMKSIISVCQNKDIYVIEDCAQAHGIKLAGDIGCFSFFPGKNIGAYGDAGMIVTNSEELAKRCRMMINHGREGKFGHTIPGGNYRMDDIQAAVLLVKERQWEKIIKDRFANVRGYWKLLGKEPQNSAPSHLHLFTILCKNRDEVFEHLKKNDVQAGIHYPTPVPHEPVFAYLEHMEGDFPVAEKFANETLSLPISPKLDFMEIPKIVRLINEVRK